MLEKITNINLKSEFFNGRKAVSAYKNSLKNNILRNDWHDSVNLSPAYRFLAQVDWQLKEMKNLSANKVFIDFFFSGYEFQTTLDLSNHAKLNLLEYNVTNQATDKKVGAVITATLSVSINKQKSEFVDVLTELHGVNILFSRLSLLNLGEELNFNNNILYELFDGILRMVNKEFDYLNSCLFAFVEKALNIKMVTSDITTTGLIGSDGLNRIKLLNVDVRKN